MLILRVVCLLVHVSVESQQVSWKGCQKTKLLVLKPSLACCLKEGTTNNIGRLLAAWIFSQTCTCRYIMVPYDDMKSEDAKLNRRYLAFNKSSTYQQVTQKSSLHSKTKVHSWHSPQQNNPTQQSKLSTLCFPPCSYFLHISLDTASVRHNKIQASPKPHCSIGREADQPSATLPRQCLLAPWQLMFNIPIISELQPCFFLFATQQHQPWWVKNLSNEKSLKRCQIIAPKISKRDVIVTSANFLVSSFI